MLWVHSETLPARCRTPPALASRSSSVRHGRGPWTGKIGGHRRFGVVPVAPRVEPRLGARGQKLPLPRARQAPSRPAREGVRRPPAHAGRRKVGLARLPLPVAGNIVLALGFLRVREESGPGERIVEERLVLAAAHLAPSDLDPGGRRLGGGEEGARVAKLRVGQDHREPGQAHVGRETDRIRPALDPCVRACLAAPRRDSRAAASRRRSESRGGDCGWPARWEARPR